MSRHIVKCEAGSYNLVEDGVVTFSITRTEPGDWYDHDPNHPWVIARRFPSGSQVEARCKTLAAAKKWLLG
jgi:hypothetical protein